MGCVLQVRLFVNNPRSINLNLSFPRVAWVKLPPDRQLWVQV